MMLVHIGQPEAAERVHNAWLRTIEDGVHTYDIFKEGVSKQKVGTKEFAQAVVARLGPEAGDSSRPPLRQAARRQTRSGSAAAAPAKKELVGIDVFVDWEAATPTSSAPTLRKLAGDEFELTDAQQPRHQGLARRLARDVLRTTWRCRFMREGRRAVSHDR